MGDICKERSENAHWGIKREREREEDNYHLRRWMKQKATTCTRKIYVLNQEQYKVFIVKQSETKVQRREVTETRSSAVTFCNKFHLDLESED